MTRRQNDTVIERARRLFVFHRLWEGDPGTQDFWVGVI